MKSILSKVFIFNFLLLLGCNQPEKPINVFTLKGKISGQDTGKIILGIRTDSVIIYDTALISNGEFVFKGKIDEPYGVELNAGNDSNRVSFFIDPADMQILLIKDSFSQYKLLGSKTNDESNEIDSLCYGNSQIMQSLREAYFNNSELLNNVQNENERKKLIAENDSLDLKITEAREKEYGIWLYFIINHPKSHLSPLYLNMLRQREFISLDSTKSLFSNLDNSVKITLFGRQLSNDIKIQENTQIGASAPDFKAIDINNQQITLSQFKGEKVILIELWASWCGPCRSGFPFLRSLYNKFHSKGFDIIAIANLDINQETWKSAIIQEKIEDWHHVATIFREDEPLNQDILKNYPLGPIPMSFLIDKSGKVVGSYVGHSENNENELEDKLIELLK